MGIEMSLTSEQRACVEQLDGPMVISAGAGSGKTMVLTKKIVRLLAGAPTGSADDESRCDIDEILAITFTEKASEELRFRLKKALYAEGLHAQALRVDEAWVSTIHGMCLRMLKEHALDLGMDPSFGVLDETSARQLLSESIDDAFLSCREEGRGVALDSLFLEYPTSSSDRGARSSVRGMVETLTRKAIASPRGAKCFKRVAAPRSAKCLKDAFFRLAHAAGDLARTQNESGRRDCFLDSIERFLGQEASLRASASSRTLLKCAELCPRPAADFGTRSYKEAAKELQALYADLLLEAEGVLSRPHLDLLLVLARCAYEGYVQKKRERGMLDNDDLLIFAADALRKNKKMAAAYANKFKLVLVDEFQDTDQLQLQIISKLSGVAGERLCVVGDVQQSIYRFRGADVSLFERHIENVRGLNPQGVVELRDNFRSHEAVLGFVDRIFGCPGMSGGFMPMRASRISEGSFPQEEHRIRVFRTLYRGAITAGQAREAEARRIARAFKEFQAKGCRPSDMVLLLGRMTHADVYAAAMRREGLPCVVAGGSTFARAPEPYVILRLLEVIANPRKTASLHDVLSSGMFEISGRDLMALCARPEGWRPIYEGLRAVAASCGQGRFSRELERAACVLERACYGSRGESVARLVMRCVVDAGWIARLEARGAEGVAAAANVLKAVRVLEDLERQGARGAASLSAAFAAYLKSAKEAPGILPGRNEGFVRIMTVHASKGLEFDVVAVAEMDAASSRTAALSCETVEGQTLVSLRLGSSGAVFKVPSACEGVKARFADLEPSQYAEALKELKRYSREQEAQERRRLLYVALTRAKEAVVLSSLEKRPSSKSASAQRASGVMADVVRALFPEGEPAERRAVVELERGASVLVECVDAGEGADVPPEEASQPVSCSEASALASQRVSCIEPTRRFRSLERGDSGVSLSDLARKASASDSDDAQREFWAALQADLTAESQGVARIQAAFCDAAKYAVWTLHQTGESVSACAAMPDEHRLAAISSRHGLTASQGEQLRAVLEEWISGEGPCALGETGFAFGKHCEEELTTLFQDIYVRVIK